MNTPAEENLFNITLSQEGAANMVRVYRMSRWIFAAVTAISALFLTTSVIRYVGYKEYPIEGSWLYFLELRVAPLYWLFSTLIMFMQSYYFFRFTAIAKKGIQTGQSELFNTSLQWLVKNTMVAVFLCILDLVSAVFYFYLEYRNLIDGPPSA